MTGIIPPNVTYPWSTGFGIAGDPPPCDDPGTAPAPPNVTFPWFTGGWQKGECPWGDGEPEPTGPQLLTVSPDTVTLPFTSMVILTFTGQNLAELGMVSLQFDGVGKENVFPMNQTDDGFIVYQNGFVNQPPSVNTVVEFCGHLGAPSWEIVTRLRLNLQ